MSFFEQLNKDAQYIEDLLTLRLGQKSNHNSPTLDSAIAYSLLGGGKRIRAYLTMEFCELCKQPRITAEDYACALEMIHAFSLIHDDLPSMDNDDMRRGKPSNHKAFGEATAILAGDSLALDAFRMTAGNLACTEIQNLQAVSVLSAKSGSMGMCAGQQFDIDGEGKSLNRDELMRLVDLKTGALFSCGCMLGCIAAEASNAQKEAAERFGLLCGRAFQITDDLLDIRSTAEELGKTVGKDEQQQKSTFPALLGEDGAEEYAKECIAEAKKALDAFDDSDSKERLCELCDYILTRKK